ncbi:MAG TPA: LPS export ABC transporter periplasmic protein LptC [Ignavibacteriaceae bacterium]|nr:LPS export ABC transporter periplasmic protein LptC [Ignavibacteriaceae bacterium]
MKYLILFVAAIILISCNSEKVKPTVNASLDTNKLPTQESWDAVVTFSDSGRTKAILYAGHLRVFDESKETLLDQNIKVDFFDENEHKTSTLTAKRGKVDDNTKDLYAMDSVVVVSDSGTTVTSEELMFRNEDQKIVSDKFVTITSPKETIQGYGFKSDQALRNYVIYNITYTARTDSTK